MKNTFIAFLEAWKKEKEILEEENSKVINSKIKEINILNHKINTVEEFFNKEKEIDETKELHEKETDSEMKELWAEEISIKEQELIEKSESIANLFMPNKKQSSIIEIRSGEGGEEASLFALELSQMYQKWAKINNWVWKTFSINYTSVGGLKEGIFEITGTNASIFFASESGVHCVKRVPKTEKKGRIHTSTATVAVLEEPEECEVVIDAKDLKIDVFRSSGPGGQSVNTTDSAVRITHIPTGIVVSQQDEKSQHKNKEKGLKILKARVYDLEKQKAHEEQSELRRSAIGSGTRTERFRTYHFVQNWVKDSRITRSCHNVTNFMEAVDLEKFSKDLIWKTIEETI